MNLPNRLTVFRIVLIPIVILIYIFPFAQFGMEPRVFLTGPVRLPLINVMSTGLTEALTSQLAHSHIASYLYNENLLLMLIQTHFG